MRWFFLLLIFVVSAQTCKKSTNPTPLQIPPHFGNQYIIPSDNPLTKNGIELGKRLFYDSRLSSNNQISCATCHQQARAFTDGTQFSQGVRGKKLSRNTMSLVNLLWTKQFFWDGRASSLEEQALHPIQDSLEMNMRLEDLVLKLQQIPEYPPLFKKAFGTSQITAQRIAQAIAQFERTLISANSRYDKIVRGEVEPSEQELRAIQLFMTHPIPENNIRGGNCGDCHGSHLTTLNTFHNNGLEKLPKDIGVEMFSKNPFDKGKMKAPSLRNITLTAPYMHDGRFKTLEEVLDHYNEHIQDSPYLDPLIMEATNEVKGKTLKLTAQEKKDIILFLKMLTDSTFITNPKFAKPN